MTQELTRAKELLDRGEYTCVIIHTGNIYRERRRGVAPLLALLESEADCKGASVADKVVGAGAAYLYALLEIKELYAAVLSKPAKDILTSYCIDVHAGITVAHINNRAGNGICPIECAVANARDAQDALAKIKERHKQLTEEK